MKHVKKGEHTMSKIVLKIKNYFSENKEAFILGMMGLNENISPESIRAEVENVNVFSK